MIDIEELISQRDYYKSLLQQLVYTINQDKDGSYFICSDANQLVDSIFGVVGEMDD